MDDTVTRMFSVPAAETTTAAEMGWCCIFFFITSSAFIARHFLYARCHFCSETASRVKGLNVSVMENTTFCTALNCVGCILLIVSVQWWKGIRMYQHASGPSDLWFWHAYDPRRPLSGSGVSQVLHEQTQIYREHRKILTLSFCINPNFPYHIFVLNLLFCSITNNHLIILFPQLTGCYMRHLDNPPEWTFFYPNNQETRFSTFSGLLKKSATFPCSFDESPPKVLSRWTC